MAPFRVGAALGSIAGRTVVILTVGLTLAVAASLVVAEQVRIRDLEQLRRANLVAAVAAAVEGLRVRPVETEAAVRAGRAPGIRFGPAAAPSGVRDPDAEALLAGRIGAAAAARVVRVPAPQCARDGAAAASGADLPLDCWNVAFVGRDGRRRVLLADLPLIHVYRSAFVEPLYLVLLAGIGLLVAVLLTRSTIAPLRRLTGAARRFSASADPTEIPERGPREVREALRTFNLMQRRVRDGVRERTHILASVSHDLQTPLTRMRLRVEKVDDPGLRAELVADIAAMQRLVGEGLDLARSTEVREPWSVVDVDSLLSSLADDMAELGAPVRVGARSGARVRVRLAALTRTVQNLVDNAVRHGGGAELASGLDGDAVVVTVRDRGPGIPEADLDAAFEPFTRLADARSEVQGGTGLGLAIARSQAATFGGAVTLANAVGGGLVATVRIPVGTDT